MFSTPAQQSKTCYSNLTIKKIKVVCEKESKKHKNLLSSILQTVHYNNESMIGRVSRSVAVALHNYCEFEKTNFKYDLSMN